MITILQKIPYLSPEENKKFEEQALSLKTKYNKCLGDSTILTEIDDQIESLDQRISEISSKKQLPEK